MYKLGTVAWGMAMSAPDLTPERLSEIKILLVIVGVLIAFVALPFVLSWWLERKNRILRSAHQFYCHRCRRGTDWSQDRKQCLECVPADKA